MRDASIIISQANIDQSKNSPKMDNHHWIHIEIYRGHDDPKRHCFIYERMWEVTDMTNNDKKIAQFVGALKKKALTWYMNFIQNHPRKNDETRMFYPSSKMKMWHISLLNKLKEIKQTPRETIQEYNKRFKDLLNQIPYTIDVNLLVQSYVTGLQHHVRSPLIMHEIKTLEEALEKAQ